MQKNTFLCFSLQKFHARDMFWMSFPSHNDIKHYLTLYKNKNIYKNKKFFIIENKHETFFSLRYAFPLCILSWASKRQMQYVLLVCKCFNAAHFGLCTHTHLNHFNNQHTVSVLCALSSQTPFSQPHSVSKRGHQHNYGFHQCVSERQVEMY